MSRLSSKLPAAFRRLTWSNLAAQSAEQIGLAAAPIVAVLALGAGAGETGFLQTASTLPFLVFAIPAGLLADRLRRARLMAAAESLRVISLIAIVVLIQAGHLSLFVLAMLGMIGACGTVVYSVTAPALVPSLVEADALPTANGRIELARTAAYAGGPALGGALVGTIGGAPAFAVAATLSATAVILLAGLREPPRPQAERRHPISELKEGALFVSRNAMLRAIFVTQFIFAIASFALQAVYVPYAIKSLGFSAMTVGVTLAAFGVGMTVGALTAPHLIRKFHFGGVILFGPISGFVAAMIMVATIWLPSPVLAALSFFIMGVGPIIWVVSTTTLRQMITPSALLGRVSAINIASYGARPIGAALGGLVGGLDGAEASLIVSAIAFALQVATIVFSPLPALARPPQPVNGVAQTKPEEPDA
ncbi:MAG: MFS transporter [Methylobacteriaceae bacterium]|nr:MFS transporter [Methylobacteriaceae bacterium]